MKYCKNCGKELDDNAYVCPNCGVKVEEDAPVVEEHRTNGLAIAGFVLSFFIPLVGLILSIVGLVKVKVYHSGKGLAIAGIVLSVVFWIANILIMQLWLLPMLKSMTSRLALQMLFTLSL